jgi:hypothetical protein
MHSPSWFLDNLSDLTSHARALSASLPQALPTAVFTDPKCYVNCASHDERLGRTSAMDPRDAIAFPVVSKELKVCIKMSSRLMCFYRTSRPVCTEGGVRLGERECANFILVADRTTHRQHLVLSR